MIAAAAADHGCITVEPLPRRLGRHAFNRPTLTVARDLLGKFIVHRVDGERISAMIAETEAYKGPRDRASHAYGGRRTRRVEPLYRDGGTIYVYFVYGMHWMLNFSTAGEGVPEGVLVRGVIVNSGLNRALLSGPGRVTRYLRIDGKLDGTDVTDADDIAVEDRGVRVAASCVTKGPRVGVDYAGPYWAARPWRFRIHAGVRTNPSGHCA